ncbi:SDR family NAD(P)-dependent oxidoreductase [Peribacillus glennii]|uniref:SDR family NAD(P)-dependent oxidoreductase n=1 Tax=Peribacillus glennii TaxID=2303991 RepID=A0A372LB77_9BACI|nr:SDR family NAD(P)-dependent oxidoreductase [Peribacillus glennii]
MTISQSFSILINSAGIDHYRPFEKIRKRETKEMLNTNVLGIFQVTHADPPVG